MIEKENAEIIHRFFQSTKASFEEMVVQLLDQYKAIYTPVRIVVFGSPMSNEDYISGFECIKEAVRKHFKTNLPLVSCVAQPPHSENLVMEVHEVALREEDTISYKNIEDISYIVVERIGCKRLFMSGVIGDVLKQTIREQSDEVFAKIAKVLKVENMSISSIIRQWNYIEKITAYDVEGHQHYQDFNDARSIFYQGVDWNTGYPAATGIGTQWGGIMIDLDALYCKDETVLLRGVDNPLQVAAHAYSQNVLLGEKDIKLDHKTTPKFERAKAVWKDDHGFVYISGTAAIRGELSLENVGIEEQTTITLENIEYLVSRDNLQKSGIPVTENASLIIFRVYVKQWEDMEKAKETITKRYPNLPAIYTLTDVCRSELLIEIEGVGILQ